MKAFITYLRDYFRTTSKPAFFITVLFVASLVVANYTFGIERRIQALGHWYVSLGAFVGFYALVLAAAWGLQYEWGKDLRAAAGDARVLGPEVSAGGRGTGEGDARAGRFFQPRLLVLLGVAILYFSLKMIHWDLSVVLPSLSYPWSRYALIVLQLPAKLLLLVMVLYACRRWGLLEGPGAGSGMGGEVRSWSQAVGLTTRNFDARPYFLLLLAVVPLVALASTQPDFLRVYPKVKSVAFINGYTTTLWPWKLCYELSYGLDFLSIELLFRGLLVIGLLRYAGEHAILPMAAFYCTIHFGKPLGECVSAFFGGLILGVIAARTRTVLGGLIVHLGLAWMMELGGWLGSAFH